MLRTLLALAVGAGLALPAWAAERWHMPTPYPEGEHHTRNVHQFAADVKQASGGQLDIQVHSAASLFKHAQVHRAVRTGQVPLGELLMGLLGNDNAIFKLDNIPFLATDFDSAQALWQASRPEIESILDAQGLTLLFAVPWPPQGLYSRQAIDSVADFKRLKLRAYSPLTARLADLLGATPVNVQVPEIAQAFSTGLINAMFTSPSTGVSSQAWDYVDYYTDARAWIPKNMVIMNKRAFRKLPDNHQQVILAAAATAEQRGWQMAREETDNKTRTLHENGMKIVQANETLQDELERIGERMAREWLQETGAEGKRILDRYRRAE